MILFYIALVLLIVASICATLLEQYFSVEPPLGYRNLPGPKGVWLSLSPEKSCL
jgi:hypothetical protein